MRAQASPAVRILQEIAATAGEGESPAASYATQGAQEHRVRHGAHQDHVQQHDRDDHRPRRATSISWASPATWASRARASRRRSPRSWRPKPPPSRAMEHGVRKVDVFVKGPGSGRETAIRSLQAAGIEVLGIKDVHPHPAQRLPPSQAAEGLSDMARYTGAVCRLCRRERMKLFLKGAKCDSMSCPIENRPYPPGMHGQWPHPRERVPAAASREAEDQAHLRPAREAVPRPLPAGQRSDRHHG